MPGQVKRILQWIFWIFVIYAIVTSPDKAAEIVHNVWAIIVQAFTAVGTFFDKVLSR